MFGVSDAGGRKLLFHIYPDPPSSPALLSALADPWKVIEKEGKFHLPAFCPVFLLKIETARTNLKT